MKPSAGPSASAMPSGLSARRGERPSTDRGTLPRANTMSLKPHELQGCVRERPLSDTHPETPHDSGSVSDISVAPAAIRTPTAALANTPPAHRHLDLLPATSPRRHRGVRLQKARSRPPSSLSPLLRVAARRITGVSVTDRLCRSLTAGITGLTVRERCTNSFSHFSLTLLSGRELVIRWLWGAGIRVARRLLG
jgi:hypothetical protein